MKKLAILIALSFFINSFGQQYSKKWADINYAGDAKNYHLMDIYLPKAVKTSYPVVVYIYGSAWYSNSSKGADMNTIGKALLDAGYAVVTPNHRSSSDTLYPGQINDIKAVIRFVRGNAATYSLDTAFIGISGSSSGGHLAALAATSVGVKKFTVDSTTMNIEGNVGKYNTFSSKVHAACDWFGPTDLLKMDSCRGSSMYAEGQSPEETLIGGTKKALRNKFVMLSPTTYIDSTDCPFLIFHGDADNVVPYCESELLYNALQLYGVQSEYVRVPGGQHYTGTHTDANIKKMVDFFNKISKNNISAVIALNNTVKTYVANNTLTIEGISDFSVYQYEIIDISGKKLRSNAFTTSKIDIASLKNGVYFFKLQSKDGNSMIDKFVK
ncbi:MAG TPA: prolyl oligopeptidase family serine peptidase [Bacteroidales bacterium]|nr:prolyl oligopeptidase family serine peptidase [Bacteroidales bacterium]